jgi:toxin HigB-1
MIRSFKDKEAKKIFERQRSRRLSVDVQRIALRKLVMLDAAEDLNDLRVPPGNRLEALSGDRQGQHSIRINARWRICFVWTEAGPAEVEIVDYH